MRITKACKGRWTDEYQEYTDPNGRKFYWLTGKFKNEEPDNEDTDEWCCRMALCRLWLPLSTGLTLATLPF